MSNTIKATRAELLTQVRDLRSRVYLRDQNSSIIRSDYGFNALVPVIRAFVGEDSEVQVIPGKRTLPSSERITNAELLENLNTARAELLAVEY